VGEAAALGRESGPRISALREEQKSRRLSGDHAEALEAAGVRE